MIFRSPGTRMLVEYCSPNTLYLCASYGIIRQTSDVIYLNWPRYQSLARSGHLEWE